MRVALVSIGLIPSRGISFAGIAAVRRDFAVKTEVSVV